MKLQELIRGFTTAVSFLLIPSTIVYMGYSLFITHSVKIVIACAVVLYTAIHVNKSL